MNLINGFFSLFYPTQCCCCKRYIKDFRYFYICEKCYNSIKNINQNVCKMCLKPLSSEYVDICIECRERKKTYFEYIKASVYYESPIKELIHIFKFGQKKSAVKILGKIILEKTGDEFFNDIDYITFVPLSKKTSDERKFNHAKVLACYIGKSKGIKVLDVIKKIKETQDQSNLKREERLKNLKDAFEIKKEKEKIIYGKKIIIVDDIYTTGSTINEIAKILFEKRAQKIFGLVVARAL